MTTRKCSDHYESGTAVCLLLRGETFSEPVDIPVPESSPFGVYVSGGEGQRWAAQLVACSTERVAVRAFRTTGLAGDTDAVCRVSWVTQERAS